MCINQRPLKAIITSGPAAARDGIRRTLMLSSDLSSCGQNNLVLDYWQHANISMKYNTYEALVTRGQACKCYTKTRLCNDIRYLLLLDNFVMAWDHNFISTEFFIFNCIYVCDEKAMTPWWCDDGHISLYFPVKSFIFHQEDGPTKWARSGVVPVKREVRYTV